MQNTDDKPQGETPAVVVQQQEVLRRAREAERDTFAPAPAEDSGAPCCDPSDDDAERPRCGFYARLEAAEQKIQRQAKEITRLTSRLSASEKERETLYDLAFTHGYAACLDDPSDMPTSKFNQLFPDRTRD